MIYTTYVGKKCLDVPFSQQPLDWKNIMQAQNPAYFFEMTQLKCGWDIGLKKNTASMVIVQYHGSLNIFFNA